MNGTKASLKNAIDDRAQAIIDLVSKLATDQNYKKIIGLRDFRKQFTELVEASAQASCIDEFKLYIKYKGAKEGTRNIWGNLSTPFNAIIDELIKKVANEILENDETIANDGTIKAETVRKEVLRRFCGYLMWRVHADISERGVR